MTITEQPGTAPAPDQVLELLDAWLGHQRAALDDLAGALRAIRGELLPDHQATPACRIRTDQQVLHEDGWWYVTSVRRVDLDTVHLVLHRAGHDALDLIVSPDDTFTTAELIA